MLFIAAALGELFTRLDMPGYAAMCTQDSTAEIITGYEQRGRAAGLKAYRAALAASGLQPPDLPGVLVWGSVMGTEEAAAYWSASAALEMAVAAGTLRPGTPGWRRTAAQLTARFLDSVHDDTAGTTWLQWVHTERLQRFADSRGPARARLAEPLADQLVHPVPLPADAEQVLAPIRWLLDHTAAGAALTTTGNLARPLVAEGCRLFGWLTTTGNPRSESDIVELLALRDWARQIGVVRRSGRRLVLSSMGRTVYAGGTPDLWRSTMDSLLGPGDADAAAGEIALMLLLTGEDLDYRDLNDRVADVLAGEGWHRQATGQPITGDHVAGLLGNLRRPASAARPDHPGTTGTTRAAYRDRPSRRPHRPACPRTAPANPPHRLSRQPVTPAAPGGRPTATIRLSAEAVSSWQVYQPRAVASMFDGAAEWHDHLLSVAGDGHSLHSTG